MRQLALCLALLTAATAHAERPPPGDCAGMYWDLTAVFEAGDRVFARVLLTRVGPGDLVAAGQGHWLAPDGTVTPFQNARRHGHFDLDAAGRALRIGSTELDLTGERHRFEVDNDKRGVKLRIEVAASDAISLPVQEGELAVEVLHLGSQASARVWRAGMASARTLRGRATWVRTRHTACERDLAAMRVDVHRLAADAGALLVHERLTDDTERTWLGWRDADGAVAVRRPAQVVLQAWRREADVGSLPGRLLLSDGGTKGEIAIDTTLLAFDPLDALPRLVRMLYWFGANPRRVWTDAHLDLVGLASSEATPLPRGPALASLTFLHDTPPNLPPETGR